jgi:antirestriction protein ArdC
MFINGTNKHVYSARNAQQLAEAMQRNGWTSTEFAGFNQWRNAGRFVKKGAKGTAIEMFVDKKIETNGTDEKLKVRKVKFVFNIEQTEQLPG